MKKKLFDLLFVEYPIGYLVFIIGGMIAILIFSSSIRIPVYDTYEITICENTEGIYFINPTSTIDFDSSVYLYQSRDESIEIIHDYIVSGDFIFFNSKKYNAGDRVYVDIKINESSVLSYIFQ